MAAAAQPDDAIEFFAVNFLGDLSAMCAQRASTSHSVPTLYDISIDALATNFRQLKWLFAYLPPASQFEVYERMHTQGRLCQIGYEWTELEVIAKLLTVTTKRAKMHRLFQSLLDHGVTLGDLWLTALSHQCRSFCDPSVPRADFHMLNYEKTIELAISLGRFLCEGGWFKGTEGCMRACLSALDNRARQQSTMWILLRRLDCYFWLLECHNGYCQYQNAYDDVVRCQKLLAEIRHKANEANIDVPLNHPAIYIQFALLHFYVGDYTLSFDWAVKAIDKLDDRTPIKCISNTSLQTIIDVCRHASKILVVRREFTAAEILIRHAVRLARQHFDDARALPAPLCDLGFFLMNMDQTESATQIYQRALDNRIAQFGSGNNLKLAQTHEDFAYALYVRDYSSGDFQEAKSHAERAIEISKRLLPDDHLLHASGRRVKALILEEIAIDTINKVRANELLCEAAQLHQSALQMCRNVFGEHNVQIAKHCGNLGRLYQTMRRYEEAEAMHKNAIAVKEHLLGGDDYEVALSVGHLASLYNYDMERYEDAEKLYLRSIKIGHKLFGAGYSGLEYDYRGLIHVYGALGDQDKVSEYLQKLDEWRWLRHEMVEQNASKDIWEELKPPAEPTVDVLRKFRENMKNPLEID